MNRESPIDEELKRKREASSVSELDSSVSTTPKVEKQKKKKSKQKQSDNKSGEMANSLEDNRDVITQMKKINSKNNNVSKEQLLSGNLKDKGVQEGLWSAMNDSNAFFVLVKSDFNKVFGWFAPVKF